MIAPELPVAPLPELINVNGHTRLSSAANRAQPKESPSFKSTKKGLCWIGGRIRALRDSLGMTQQELATKACLPRTYISRVENNRVMPGLEIAGKLCAILGISLRWLVTDPGQTHAGILDEFGRLTEKQQKGLIMYLRKKVVEGCIA